MGRRCPTRYPLTLLFLRASGDSVAILERRVGRLRAKLERRLAAEGGRSRSRSGSEKAGPYIARDAVEDSGSEQRQ